MANKVEVPCPDDCPLRGLSHQHLVTEEGKPKHHKKKHRPLDDSSEQNMLYKRNRTNYNKRHNR